MKKPLAAAIAAIFVASALASCSIGRDADINSNIRVTSSDATDAAAWLEARIGDKLTKRVVIGTDADEYGVNVDTLENDGYFIRSFGREDVLFASSPAGLDRAARKYARMVESGAVTDVTYHEGYRVKRLTVAGNDISEYAIIIPDRDDNATPLAASELAAYVEKTCGALLPVFTADEYAAASEKPSRRIVLTYGDKALGNEGYTISVDGDGTLAIRGGLWRGTLFGVYDLLEQDIGWRFLGSGGNIVRKPFIPIEKREYLYEAEHIDLTSAINRTEKPSIATRGYGDRDGHTEPASDGDIMQLTREKWSYTPTCNYGFAYPACHGLQGAHGKIFSGEYEGLYDGLSKTGKQPCFTNEEILAAIDNYALTIVKERLDAGQQIGKECNVVDVAHWDGMPHTFCQCKNCVAVERVEGNHCGPYLRMANRVCALLDEHYPGVGAAILAYCGADELPAVTRPAHNLYIAYCFYLGEGYEGCQNHCISGEGCATEKGMTNKLPAKRFKEWAEVMDGSMIQVWVYPSNCGNLCYNAPQYLTLLDNAKFLASYGVGHVYHDTRWEDNGLINEELSAYLLLRFEWDATISRETARDMMREWFALIYGDAGDLIYELSIFAEDAGDRAGCWGSFNSHSEDRVDYEYVSENAERIWELCDILPKLAGSAAEEELIEKYITGFLFMTLRARYDEMYVNGSAEERDYITERYREVWSLFRKHDLSVYGGINSHLKAPETFDPDVDPRDWINGSIFKNAQ